MTKGKSKKKTKKTTTAKKLSSVVEMGDFFNMPAQKFRVVDMRKPFPRDNADEIIPMTPAQVLEYCRGILRCGLIMRMDFKVNPDKPSYKNREKK